MFNGYGNSQIHYGNNLFYYGNEAKWENFLFLRLTSGPHGCKIGPFVVME